MKTLVMSSLIMSVSAMALTAKVEKPANVVEGTSIGQYAKPGAPVDITYKITHVEAGDVSEVSITLSTRLTSGSMKVKMDIDKSLTKVSGSNNNLNFTMSEKEKSFPINLQVATSKDGLYYIRLLVKIKGKGMRAFAVPVYVGDGKLKREKAPIQKSASGENISVSNAVETMER